MLRAAERVRRATGWGVLGFAILLVGGGLWAADNPLLGTWKLNLSKSKWNPPPGPLRQITTYAPFGEDGLFVTIEGVNAQGEPTFAQWAATYDGRDYPVPSSRTGVSLRLKRIDFYTTERTDYKDGKPLTTFRRVVSKDGRTMTVTQTGTSESGRLINNVVVYDRQ